MSDNFDSNVNGLGTSLPLGRADMYLKRGDFANAKSYYEDVLNNDASNARAYLGLLLIEAGVTQAEDLSSSNFDYKNSENYKNLVRCGGESLIPPPGSVAKSYVNTAAKEDSASEAQYSEALRIMQRARYAQDYQTAANIFLTIKGYKDAAKLYNECNDKAVEADRFALYKEAKMKMNSTSEEVLISAIQQFDSISGWSDVDNLKAQTQKRLDEIREKRLQEESLVEKQKRKEKRAVAITIPAVIVVIAAIIAVIVILVPYLKYKKAMDLKTEGNFIEASNSFRALGDYKDAVDQVDACKYKEAERLLETEQYDEAIDLFYSIGGYGDAAIQAINCEKMLAKQADLSKAQSQIDKLKKSAEGDVVTIGDYEWTVLKIEDGNALLFANSAVNILPYNTEFKEIEWRDCSLRAWLNGEFYNSFNKEIKTRIQQTTISNPNNNRAKTPDGAAAPDGEDTQDYIYILNSDEVVNLLGGVSGRVSDTWWWTRTPGQYSSYASRVGNDGQIYLDGDFVSALCGVRPVMWVSVS